MEAEAAQARNAPESVFTPFEDRLELLSKCARHFSDGSDTQHAQVRPPPPRGLRCLTPTATYAPVPFQLFEALLTLDEAQVERVVAVMKCALDFKPTPAAQRVMARRGRPGSRSGSRAPSRDSSLGSQRSRSGSRDHGVKRKPSGESADQKEAKKSKDGSGVKASGLAAKQPKPTGQPGPDPLVPQQMPQHQPAQQPSEEPSQETTDPSRGHQPDRPPAPSSTPASGLTDSVEKMTESVLQSGVPSRPAIDPKIKLDFSGDAALGVVTPIGGAPFRPSHAEKLVLLLEDQHRFGSLCAPCAWRLARCFEVCPVDSEAALERVLQEAVSVTAHHPEMEVYIPKILLLLGIAMDTKRFRGVLRFHGLTPIGRRLFSVCPLC